jgi:hypothetical protein
VLVEIQSWDRVAIHRDVAETVDGILRGYRPAPEVLELADGEVRQVTDAEVYGEAIFNTVPAVERARSSFQQTPVAAATATQAPASRGPRIYPFGISRNRLLQAMHDTGSGASLSERLEDSDVVLTDRSYFRRKPQALRDAEARGIPIFVLKTNTLLQMQQALMSIAANSPNDPVLNAMTEAEEAIHAVISQDRPIELAPQRAYIRRLQHELAQRFNLSSQSRGREPQRRVRIMPMGARNSGYIDEEV